jgi:hypothetical protein
MKSLLLILFFAFSLSSHAQTANGDLSIAITATSSFYGTNMRIIISKYAGSIKVVYKLKDSVNYRGLLKNERYKSLEKITRADYNVNTNLDTIRKANKEEQDITEKYTYYNKDSVIVGVNKDTSYTSLLNKISNTTTDSLENKEANKNRIVFDGTFFEFNIKSGKDDRTLEVHSPSPQSHPILYKLLTQTIDLYRRIKVNEFLSKNRTDGY